MTIYLDNKYTRWYYSIVTNAKNQNRTKFKGCYYEKHHIIPQSLGGSESPENLVLLTYREHFLCHWLLIKMCVNKQHTIKMGKALKRMTTLNGSQERVLVGWKIELGKKYASEAQYQRWQDDEFRSRMEEITSSQEYKNKKSKKSKELWVDEDYRIKHKQSMAEANSRPEVKLNRSKSSKEVQNRPDVKEKNRQGNVKSWQDEDKRQQRVENMTKAFNTPEARKNNSNAQLRPQVIAKKQESLAKTNSLPEIKQKRSDAQKEVMSRPGRKEKMSETIKQQEKVQCPHCLKILDVRNAKKWHFDKCKKRLTCL
jgi:hypothetical protein